MSGPSGPSSRAPFPPNSDPTLGPPQQQYSRPPPNSGPFPGNPPPRPGPAYGNFGPPPGYCGPLPPPGTGPFQPRGLAPLRGPPPPSFQGPPRPGQGPAFAGQRPALQEGPSQPQQRPPSIGQNQLPRPTMPPPGTRPQSGPPLQRPPGGGFGPPPPGRPPNMQFGPPPPQAAPGALRPPLMRPPPQQPVGLLPPSNQPRPAAPQNSNSGPPPQRPPQQFSGAPQNSNAGPPPQRPPQQFSGPPQNPNAGPPPQRPPQPFSGPPRPFPPGPPPNFRPPSWGAPPRAGPVLQQGGPPPGYAPGPRLPMQWPPGPPGMQAPRPLSAPPQQGGPGAPPQQGGPGGSPPTQGAKPKEQEEAGKGMVDAVQGEEAKGGEEKTPDSEKAAKAWTAHKNDEGVAYYYNSATGESTYEKPKGFVGEEVEIVPVAWERIDGTDWHLVTTNVDSKYYYNTTTQETSWQVPAAVAEQREKGGGAAPEKADGDSAVGSVKEKLQEEDANAEVGKEAPGDEGRKAEQPTEEGTEEQKASDKDKRAADFKEMLKEKKVPPFAKWDKELPKIFADARFKAIPTTAERRALFDRYVKTRAEEERMEKREALRAAMNGFRELLDETAEELDHTVTYADFETMRGDDPRFQALEKKEREALLHERIAPLRKAEEERLKQERDAAVTAFHELLAERGVTEGTRWAKIKEELREDARYKGVARAEREQVFNEFIAKWKGEKQPDVEDKLKAHEREARKRKEREEEEIERIRKNAKQKDALNSYKEILAQRIKEADATWPDWRRKIEKEAEEREVIPHMDVKELEHLFKEHVRGILDGCVRDYKRLLAEALPEDTIQTEDPDGRIPLDSWTAAKGLMRDDPRFKRLPKPERELLYRQYTDDMRKKLNLPVPANYSRDKGLGASRPAVAEAPRRESYRDHRDKRPRR